MNIVVVGTGYVGLVAGTCLAELGLKVQCLDNNQEKINSLNAGRIHIYEPGLEELMLKNVRSNRLSFSVDKNILAHADLILVAVGTPAGLDGRANLDHLFQVVEDIAIYCHTSVPIMIKSTVPVGTAQKVAARFNDLKPGNHLDIISNPEFLREGCAVNDFMRPERIIIGGTLSSHAIVKTLYAPLINRGIPILFTDNQTAELIKYTANCYLAMRIAFLNEIADIAEATCANIEHVADGIGMDSRIGRKYLSAGPGYGGSCFPKDTTALLHVAHDYGRPSKILAATIESNNERKFNMVTKITEALEGTVKDKKCAILGLTFKADTDDVRDGPALDIIPGLLDKGAIISSYDPRGIEEARKIFSDSITYHNTPYEAAQGADVVVILTEWDEFTVIDLNMLANQMRKRVIVDLRNMFKPNELIGLNIKYISIGRPIIHEA
jgi:UDPglucose 6-dehydrogenase